MAQRLEAELQLAQGQSTAAVEHLRGVLQLLQVRSQPRPLPPCTGPR